MAFSAAVMSGLGNVLRADGVKARLRAALKRIRLQVMRVEPPEMPGAGHKVTCRPVFHADY